MNGGGMEYMEQKMDELIEGSLQAQEEPINDELKTFIKDITLFLQKHTNCNPEKMEPMFQRAYELYVKYEVEKPADEYQQCLGRIFRKGKKSL